MALHGLNCELVPGTDRTVVMLSGTIDEDGGVDAIARVAGPLEINLRGVVSINSLGIRAWVNMMKSLADRPVTFAECPPLVMRQINMVPMFLGHARVVSILAAYVCDDCDESTARLIAEPDFQKPITEKVICGKCGVPMELEVPPDRLFAFLGRSNHG